MAAAGPATSADIPPQDLDAEESIIGALMLSPGAIDATRAIVAASDFYRISHGKIFAVACAMRDAGDPVDAVTLTAELARRGWLEDVGGKVRIHELAATVPAAANAPHYATIVRRHARSRQALRLALTIQEHASNGGVHEHPEIVDELRAIVTATTTATRPRLRIVSTREISTWPDPDDGHFLLGDLVLRGGRTLVVGDSGHGKTSLVLQMIEAIVAGLPFLNWQGAGKARAMIVDLEQGVKSIKRAVRDANLDQREDVFYVPQPDGLALDSNPEDVAALEHAIAEIMPDVLFIDPYYKAHRADDPNAERPIAELLRTIDGLRARYGFALILAAHPRKQQGKDQVGARKLTLDDVAGTGVIGRAVEVAVAIERLSHGYARFRFLKDREGELEVGADLALYYTKGDGGFRIDPKAEIDDVAVERQILDELATGALLTAKEWAAFLSIREQDARKKLESMAEAGVLHVIVGPPGRSKRARCYGVQTKLDTTTQPENKHADEGAKGDEYPF